jgi:hypothetical protein
MSDVAAPFEYPYPRAMERFPVLRQSTLSAFDNCGLSAAFDIEFRHGWNMAHQGRGTMFHRVAAESLRQMFRMKEDTIPVDVALEILADVLRQDEADRICPKCGNLKIKPGVDNRGRRTCTKGHKFATQLVNLPVDQIRDLYWVVIKWAHESAFDIELLVDVEQRLEGELRYPNRNGGWVPRRLSGQIDALLVDQTATHAVVIDWKDMWALPAQHPESDDEVSFKGYFQQRFYAWLIFKNYPSVQRVTLRERYVRYSESREATVSRVMEEEIERELAQLAERFDRAFDRKPATVVPTPGKHCSFCLMPTRCTIPQVARGEGRVTTEKEAVALAWQITVAEEINKDARKAAAAWAEIHGPIPTTDAKGPRVLGYVPEVRTRRPNIEQIEQAEREKGRPLTAAEIRRLYQTKTGTRFKFYRPEKPPSEAETDAEIEAKLLASIEAAKASQAAQKPHKRHLSVVPDGKDEAA